MVSADFGYRQGVATYIQRETVLDGVGSWLIVEYRHRQAASQGTAIIMNPLLTSVNSIENNSHDYGKLIVDLKNEFSIAKPDE